MIHGMQKIAAAALATVLVAQLNSPAAHESSRKDVAVRYTELGVPHIKADSYRGLGYGYGYAVAKDNICTLAATYLTVGAQRSRYLGAESVPQKDRADATFAKARTNLDSDLYYQQVKDSRIVERSLRGRSAPRFEVRDIVRGYVAGYNRYLRATGAARISDPSCRGADWVRPISEIDFYRHYHALATVNGHGSAISQIAAAAPLSGPSAKSRPTFERPRPTLGSNAIAIGSAGFAQWPRHAPRQPALSVAGRAEVLAIPTDSAREDERLRREHPWYAADPDRSHRGCSLEPHGIHGRPLRFVRVTPQARFADHISGGRPTGADVREEGLRRGEEHAAVAPLGSNGPCGPAVTARSPRESATTHCPGGRALLMQCATPTAATFVA